MANPSKLPGPSFLPRVIVRRKPRDAVSRRRKPGKLSPRKLEYRRD